MAVRTTQSTLDRSNRCSKLAYQYLDQKIVAEAFAAAACAVQNLAWVTQAICDREIKGGVLSVAGEPGVQGSIDGTRRFAADPTQFALSNTLSAEHLGKPGRLPAQGHARLVEVGPQLYEVEYIDLSKPTLVAGPSSVPAYFLGYNGANQANAMPAYVDIPKRAAQGRFLFTGALSGCSVIVTHLDPTTYRVYHDGRTNSSLLYDNVAMAVDYKDYRIPGSILALAVVYMQYVEGEWQMVLQRHDFERDGKGGIRLKRRGVAQALSTYSANDQTVKRNQAEFAAYRKQVHERLKKAATQFGVSVEGVADGLYLDGGFSYESPAIAAWIRLRKELEAKVAEDIDKIIADKYLLSKQRSSALNDEKIRQLNLTHEYYKAQFHTLLREVRDVEHLWLWQQIKTKEGAAGVLRIDESSSQNVVPVHTTSPAELYEIAQTNHEYLHKVLNRVALYSDDFRRAGSDFQRLVVQDFFLLRVADQSGGRCYPLVRAMAVALGCGGQQGVDRLVERLQVATADPQARNSMLLKDTLSTLHSNVHAVQASTQLGQFVLDEVLSRLQKTTQTSMFALNTRWHAMLLGSVVTDEVSRYYFYDPNVGMFAFGTAAALAGAMQHYLVTRGLAAYYGAFGSQSAPAFNLIEIDTRAMAEVPVGLGLNVADLSQSDELERVSEVRSQAEQTVKTHVRIAEDLQLRTALATLDAERWGARFSAASTVLANSASLNERWVLVIDNTQDLGDGRFRVQFIDRNQPGKIRWVETRDATCLKYRRFVDQHLQTLDQHFSLKGEPFRPEGGGAAAPLDGLNAGFALQALIQWFADKHRKEARNMRSSPELATLLKLHSYVNSTQMVHGAVQDVSQVIEQVSTALRNEEVIAGRFVSALGRTLNEGAGVLFGEVMVGIDAYELAYAENETQKAVFGTQLAFDAASLVTSSVGVTAGLMEASTLATMFSSGGVILGGLGVGFTALAQAFGAVAEDAKAVGRYFEMVDTAYKNKGYRYEASQDALVPLAGAVVQRLDLGKGQIEFASQYIYSTHYTWIGDLPQIDLKRDHAIEVRSGIGYGVGCQPIAQREARLIILPSTPKSYISHDYGLLPFATGRHDTGFDVIRRLQSDKFSFAFYVFPGEQIIRKIHHEYVKTTLAVVLDKTDRQLLVPTLPKELYGYLNYRFTGGGGVYQIELNEGAHVGIEKSTPSTWIMITRQLESDVIRFMDSLCDPDGDEVLYYRLMIGGVLVDIDPAHVDDIRLVQHDREQLKVNFATETTQVERIDASQWPAPGLSIEQHLQALAKAHRLQGQFVLVENYRHNDRRVGRAFYDVSRNRMLFTDTCDELAKHARLGAVTNEHAYFYHAEQAIAWRVIIATGQVEGQFNPFLGLHESQSLRLWQQGEAVYLTHRHPANGKPQSESVYQIHGTRMELLRTTGHDFLLRSLWQSNTANIFPGLKPGVPTHTLGRLIEPTKADLMMIHGTDDAGVDHRYWIRTPNDLVIKPNLEPLAADPRQFEAGEQTHSAWPIPDDLVLAGNMLLPDGGEVFFFYSKVQKALFRQKGPGPASMNDERPTASRVTTPILANVLNISGHLIAISEDGRVARLNALGQLSYEAVNEHWLQGRVSWWQDLACVAEGRATLAVFGVKDVTGKGALPVWFHNAQVVVASAFLQDKTLQFLGFEADDTTARLFEPASGRLYLQRSMTANELAVAFGTDARLKASAPIPVATESAPGQRFKSAEQVDAGIRLVTVNGEVLLRTPSGALQLVAVDAQWQQDMQTYNAWWQWLAFDAEAQVRNRYRLPEALAALARQWDAKGVLTLLGDGVQGWFDVDSGQVFSSRGIHAADNLRFLGVAVGQAAAYVYCSTNQTLYRITEKAPRLLAEFTGVKRFGATLSLHITQNDVTPLILAGVDNLILCGNAGINFYTLGAEVWAHYRTVILDHNHPASVLNRIHLAMTDSKAILVSRSDDDLLLTDGNTGATLVVRKAFNQRSDNPLIELPDATDLVRITCLVDNFIKRSYASGALVDLSIALR